MPGTIRQKTVTLSLLVVTAAGVAMAPLTITSPPMVTHRSGSVHDLMLPWLTALTTSAQEVESLVEGRSRNILALQAQSQRIETLVDEIDAFLASPEYLGDHRQVIEHYLKGRDAVLQAISEARAALQSLDFGRIPELVPLFAEGSDELETALSLLENASLARSS